MSRRPPSDLPKQSDETRPIGSGDRVARIFIPTPPAADQIRLPLNDPKRALARRRLARLIEIRRVVS
jgi:hypothetical protein